MFATDLLPDHFRRRLGAASGTFELFTAQMSTAQLFAPQSITAVTR